MLTNRFKLQTVNILFLQFAVVAMLMTTGCNDVTGPEEDHGVVDILIEPQEVEMEVGDQQPFEGFLIDEQGDTIDPAEIDGFDITWEWWSSDSDIFTVEQDGSAGTGTGEGEGEAFCILEVTITDGSSNFGGRDSSLVRLF